MSRKRRLTSKEESFAQAYIKKNGELIEAYRSSDYSQKLPAGQMSVQARKLYNKPLINLRIEELQKIATEIAENVFNITVEQRLKWLKEIAEAGLSTYKDKSGANRREGLGAARSAIDTMNDMLGTSEKSNKVKPVKIFVGVQDAS